MNQEPQQGAWKKSEIEQIWNKRITPVTVRDDTSGTYRDFNRRHLTDMDDGHYRVTQTNHEIIVHWRQKRHDA